MMEAAPQNENQEIQALRQQIDVIKRKAREAQQQLTDLIQHQNNQILHWQGIVQSIRDNWSKEQRMQHAKNEAIEDLNNVIASFQVENQKAQQIQQPLQQIQDL